MQVMPVAVAFAVVAIFAEFFADAIAVEDLIAVVAAVVAVAAAAAVVVAAAAAAAVAHHGC